MKVVHLRGPVIEYRYILQYIRKGFISVPLHVGEVVRVYNELEEVTFDSTIRPRHTKHFVSAGDILVINKSCYRVVVNNSIVPENHLVYFGNHVLIERKVDNITTFGPFKLEVDDIKSGE